MKKIISLFLLILPIRGISQNDCKIIKGAFQEGEYLSYKIYYNLGFIWVNAGEVNFTTSLKTFRNKTTYHFYGNGETYPKYDWIYKVRDVYESYADTATLSPLRFVRNVNEHNYFAHDDYVFDRNKKKIYTGEVRNKKPLKLDSISIIPCLNDVMTAIYYARSLDFSNYKVNDTIPVNFVLDGKIYQSFMRYAGKDVLKTDLLGNINCIKFCPQLIEGTIFREDGEMTVWATDDKNKIPVYVETPIKVGYIKVKLDQYKGLRNKIDCKASE